jgi:(p)ppGpp synthase/HD superfamily hydrolase
MTALSTRFRDAQTYVFDLQGRQTRKGSGVPYLGHLLGVTAIVIDAGGSEDQAIAALLHDAIEDAGGALTRAEIAERFGEPVAVLVEACSDTDQVPKPPWRARKEAYIAHLAEAPADAVLISLADKIYNCRAMLLDYAAVGEALWDRFSAPAAEQLWYYRSLADAFSGRRPGVLSDELTRLVDRLAEVSAGD